MDKPLPGAAGVLLEMFDGVAFGKSAAQTFPHLAGELHENLGAVHLNMGTLAAFARRALETGDSKPLLQVGKFLAEALSQPRAISEIENAVAISFVRAAEMRESATTSILDELPNSVRQILLEQEARERLLK